MKVGVQSERHKIRLAAFHDAVLYTRLPWDDDSSLCTALCFGLPEAMEPLYLAECWHGPSMTGDLHSYRRLRYLWFQILPVLLFLLLPS